MTKPSILLATALAFTLLGCGDKKDKDGAPAAADKAAVEKSATAATGVKAFVLPPECVEFKAAFDALIKCDKLSDSRVAMKDGYEKMLKAMTDLGDQKAAADGCKQGIESLKQTLTSAGC